MKAAAGSLVFSLALVGCGSLRTVTAPPGDLADYRAFRVAAYEGTRLARAKRYLEAHPDGAFADEVRRAFDAEEPRFFERAQASREGARRYLADLPDGPHARAALALLTALESDMQEAELRDVARKARIDDARLESAAVQRRAVGETILGAVGVLTDDGVYGVPRSEAPAPLRSLLLGPTPTTWGAAPARREIDLFFVLPTRPERESRLLTLAVDVGEEDGVTATGTLSGADMFVRWTEADQIVKLDPAAEDDRSEAAVHAQARLEGALERRFPAGKCQELRRDRELFHRVCDGWEVVVTAGARAGDDDVIVVRGPRARARKAPAP